MWLPVGYTMHRNKSLADIKAGKYDALRIFAADSGNADWTTPGKVAGAGWQTAKGTAELQPLPKGYNASAPNAKPPEPWLYVVSAACVSRHLLFGMHIRLRGCSLAPEMISPSFSTTLPSR